MAPPIDFLGSIFWQFTTFIVAIVAMVGFLVYRYYVEPVIARQMTTARWSRGQPCFIENEAGEVEFCTTDKHMPEGVKHIRGKGWFSNAIRDVTEIEASEVSDKKGRGRPPKNNGELEEGVTDNPKENDEVLQMITHTPVLKGLGKHVFFGSTTSVALTGLKTIAHADLRKTRLLSPRMYSKTQLDALATGNRIEGYKMAAKEQMKLLYIALAVIAPIAVTGIVAYLLLNGGK